MKEEKLNEVSYKPLFFFFFLIILLWLFAWHFVGSSLNSWDERGAFGDMFGAINALFSGLAFGGVIFAILLQRKELELQRQELVQTRDELRGQREALDQQNIARDKQIFESTFFQLVRFQIDITESIDVKLLGGAEGEVTVSDFREGNKPPLIGKDSFKGFFENYSQRYYTHYDHGKTIEELVDISYTDFFNKYQSDLGHYFRNLYNIYKFIDISAIAEQQKKFYSNLIRAQLSNYELLMLFYNSKSHFGIKFIKYIVKYELFDNMPLDKLIKKEHIALYDKKAYGDQLG
jgi:hypothetical protein